MAAKTTQVDLKGDKVQARSLAEAHVPRLMFDFRKNQSFQNLDIYSETKKFFDKTGAYVGTVYMQSVNGAENIVVMCDAGKKMEETRVTKELAVVENLANIVPCFIVTGDEPYSEEIVGYIACLSGSFLGPYQFFVKPSGDDKAVLEGFYHSGFEDYVAATAFPASKFLAVCAEKTILYFLPSGTAPADARVTQSADFGGWEQTEECGDVEFYDGQDGDWVWSNAMSTNPIGGGGTYWYDLLFDGVFVATNYKDIVEFSGWYFMRHGGFACTGGEDFPVECLENRGAWKTSFSPIAGCQHSFTNTNSFDDTQITNHESSVFLDEWPNGSIRLNNVLTKSAYLLDKWTSYTSSHTWNYRPIPSPYYNTWGSLPCSGCSEVVTSFTDELFIVVDGISRSITSHFSWGLDRKYRGMDGNGLVYHNTTTPKALAAVQSGSADGDYTDMAFIYVGPAAETLNGSISLSIVNPESADRYVLIPDVAGVPPDIEGRVRGQIFLGVLLNAETEAKVQLY